MTREEEVLKRLNILLYQITDSVVNGGLNMTWVQKCSDGIDGLIDKMRDK
jgi:hypothetical protein